MGIRSLLFFSATLAVAAAQFPYCNTDKYGLETMYPVPLLPVTVGPGSWDIKTPPNVCPPGYHQVGLLAKGCSEDPPPNVTVPDVYHAEISTLRSTLVMLTVYCDPVYPSGGSKSLQGPSPVVVSSSSQRYPH